MYQITLSYDGKPIHWNKNYTDALEAFNAFATFTDVGFANEFRTVNLLMPTGKMYTKNLYRTGLVTVK
jgi:hypothetical protein